jgi:hypothetical protein
LLTEASRAARSLRFRAIFFESVDARRIVSPVSTFFGRRPDDGSQFAWLARRTEMRKAFLFSATMAFFVNVETPVRPEAAFHADFEPPTQVEMPQLSLLAPRLPVEGVSAL